jgi:hypothetical protein
MPKYVSKLENLPVGSMEKRREKLMEKKMSDNHLLKDLFP